VNPTLLALFGYLLLQFGIGATFEGAETLFLASRGSALALYVGVGAWERWRAPEGRSVAV